MIATGLKQGFRRVACETDSWRVLALRFAWDWEAHLMHVLRAANSCACADLLAKEGASKHYQKKEEHLKSLILSLVGVGDGTSWDEPFISI